MLGVYLCTITWVHRQQFCAHRIPIWLGQNINKPESFGCLTDQVAPLYIPTIDAERLYAWLFVPLRAYARHERSSLESSALKNISIEFPLAFRLRTRDPESRLVIYFHGNARTLDQTRRIEAYRMVSSGASDKIHVLAFDDRGFG